MNWIGIIFAIGFCGFLALLTYGSLVVSSDASRREEDEMNKLQEEFSEEDNIYKEQLKRIKKYIENKTLRSLQVEWGMNDDRSDRLMTETVVELQIIESMIDEVMTYDDYEEGLLD